MKMRMLGNTGVKVSELSFGAGGYWGLKVFEEKQAERLIDSAIDNGINFFDTGPNYSNAHAEPRLGRILKGRFNTVIVGTKVGTKYVKGKHIKDFTPTGIEESIKNSLLNLQTDHIPLIHFHGFPKHLPDESMETIIRLKEKGIIGHIGVSTDGETAKRVVNMGVFESLMIEYNLIHKGTPGQIIIDANKKGMGVLIKSPLAQTLYSNDIFKIKKLSDVWYFLRALKNHRNKFIQGRRYRFINHIDGWSGSEIALKYVLNNEHISSAVIGTVKQENLIKNILATNKELPDEIIKAIEIA